MLLIVSVTLLSAGGGCMPAAIARCKAAWGKFHQLLPLLATRAMPFEVKGHLYDSIVRGSMLHTTETWPMSSAALHWLCHKDRHMIRWIRGFQNHDIDVLHAEMGILDLADMIRKHRLRWYGHVSRSTGEINRVRNMTIAGKKGSWSPEENME